MTTINLTNHQKRWLISSVPGTAIFLSLAHHILNFWEQRAVLLLLLLIVGIPVFIGAFFLLGAKVIPLLTRIRKERIFLFGLTAILISSFITWRVYRVPSSYQTITITPILADNQTLGLAEFKANGEIIPFEKAAVESGWEKMDGILYATQSSRPLTITFECPVHSPVSVLLVTSPQSGSAGISFEGKRVQVNPFSPNEGVDQTVFTSTYRGLPGGLFLLILIGMDIIAFSAVTLALLILQESGQEATPESSTGNRSTSHRLPLTFLIGLGLLLHLLNALSNSLAVGPDSADYLQGAVHLAEFGDLNGLPMVRGPGTTFLFGPVIWVFGRNPWGLKILLHLIAIACIPVSYQIGWQLSRNHWVAFLSGLLAALSPDLYFYSNYVMADLPNLFFVLLFCWFLILALETPKWYWILTAIHMGSAAALIRSENSLLIVIGFLALFASFLWKWRGESFTQVKLPFASEARRPSRAAVWMQLGLATAIAILPLLWWSYQNQRLYGFQSSTDYIGHAIYDGWMYFGNASNLSFIDENSEAVKQINLALREYPVTVEDMRGVPTGGEVYASLIKAGYTPQQAYKLLQSATLDSIKNNKALALEILLLKLKTGLQPAAPPDTTYSLPNETIQPNELKTEFFDTENLSIPPLIRLQRWMNKAINLVYPHLYPVWVLFCLLVLVLSLFRKPAIVWIPFVIITLTRILVPLTLGFPFWRFTLAGWIPLQIAAISWIVIAINGIKILSRSSHFNASIPSASV